MTYTASSFVLKTRNPTRSNIVTYCLIYSDRLSLQLCWIGSVIGSTLTNITKSFQYTLYKIAVYANLMLFLCDKIEIVNQDVLYAHSNVINDGNSSTACEQKIRCARRLLYINLQTFVVKQSISACALLSVFLLIKTKIR